MVLWKRTVVFSLLTLLLSSTGLSQTPVGQADQVFGPGVFTVFEEPFATHGVAADQKVAFIVEVAYQPQVHILNRITRQNLGTLTPPTGGFGTPLFIRLRNAENVGLLGSRGELIILDGPTLDLMGQVPSRLLIYEYQYQPGQGVQAQHIATHDLPLNTNPPYLPPNGMTFASSFELLPNGEIVVVDMSSLWVSDSSFNNWRMALTSPEFVPSGYCSTVTVDGVEHPGIYMSVRDENWQKIRVPYQLRMPPGMPPIVPPLKGAAYVALTDQVAFLKVASPGGVFSIDRTTLMDQTVPPNEKSYGHFVAPEIGLSDFSGDVVYDRYHPDSEWVYWQRTPSEPGQDSCPGAHPYSEKWSPIYRVSVLTGEIELVAESWILFDFPTVLNVLPPLLPGSPFTSLVTSNVMEERMPENNTFLTEPALVPLTIVPMVLVGAY